MCKTCGCGVIGQQGQNPVHEHGPGLGHHHPHDHGEDHHHPHDVVIAPGMPRTVRVEEDVLYKNDLLAERNRGWFQAKGILALNLVSSPGAGKTSILERTLLDLGKEKSFFVIEGDQQTDNDARRIEAAGAPVYQINTGQMCHLDAGMIQDALNTLQPIDGSVVMIENVGNLICPALFDLGEACKVAIASLPEGEDKPIKYPYMFQAAQLILLNKMDLLPHLSFDPDRFGEFVQRVNPEATVIALSAQSGEGMEDWYAWLREQISGSRLSK